MSDVVHIGRAAKNIKESPSFSPFSGVRLTAEKDEEGNAIVYNAGDDSGRVLEVNNPWGSQQMAADILSRIRGYEYKPFVAQGAAMNPAAELGDAVSVGDVYSVLSSVDTVFSPLMTAGIAARESGILDHEYPYDSKSARETERAISRVRTQFIIEMGRIESTIAEEYETKTEAGQTKTQLQSQITQTQSQILSTVSATYETKTAASQMETRLNSSISQTASGITSTVAATYETKAAATSKLNSANAYTNSVKTDLQSQITQTATSITSTVSSAVSKYALPAGISFQNFGYGAPPNSTAGGKNGQYYLDQANGYYYRSNGTSWVRQSNTPLPLITENLKSQIQQTASSISLQVSGANAPEWESDAYYAEGDVVKITTTNSDGLVTGTAFYEANRAHRATSSNKPPNAYYWNTADAPTVQSLIDVNLNEITISYDSQEARSSGKDNAAYITLSKGNVEIGGLVRVYNIVADEIKANVSIQAPLIYNDDGNTWLEMQDSDLSGYGSGMTIYRRVNRADVELFGLYYDSMGTVSFYGADRLMFSARADSGSYARVTCFGTWDFSSATVILPKQEAT